MKTTIKINGKRISKKDAVARYGKERIEKRIKAAIDWNRQIFPGKLGCATSSWMDGMTIIIRR